MTFLLAFQIFFSDFPSDILSGIFCDIRSDIFFGTLSISSNVLFDSVSGVSSEDRCSGWEHWARRIAVGCS